jgi:hypothetical protein
MLQFSLRNLLIAVAAVAVGTAALLNANEWWGSLLWGLALVLLVFAGLVALYRRDAQRAFWSGYLVTSALYLLLVILAERTSLPLITTKVTDWGYSLFPVSKKAQVLLSPAPAGGTGVTGGGAGMMEDMMSGMPSAPAAGGMMSGMGGMGMGATVNPNYIDQKDFLQVGHALWMLLLSWLSGTVAFCLYRTRESSSTAGA